MCLLLHQIIELCHCLCRSHLTRLHTSCDLLWYSHTSTLCLCQQVIVGNKIVHHCDSLRRLHAATLDALSNIVRDSYASLISIRFELFKGHQSLQLIH